MLVQAGTALLGQVLSLFGAKGKATAADVKARVDNMGRSWTDEFLEWDYIGAPWQISDNAFIDPYGNHQRVGNGGFTLRSKKLLNVPSIENIPFEVNQGNFYKHMNAGAYNEDGNICVHNKHLFEKHGCKFAPVELAARFSHEEPCPETEAVKKPFGFHRYLPGTYPKRFNFNDYGIIK